MNKKVVIIGAGPCGLLLAHYLLHRGQYQVEIYEGRSQQNLINTKENRTFPLSLQERGRKAIRGIAGLEEAVMSESIFCQGTIIHRQQGKKQKIKRKTPILTIDRNRLVTLFFEKLQENYPCEYLKIHFNCECIEINKITKTVTLQAKMGDHFRVNYDLLIGADGANSAIRKYLEQQANLYCEQHYVPDAYKSLFFNRINAELNIALEPNRIHASNTGKNIRILMVTQPEEKLHGVLLFPLDKNPFTSLSNQENILGFFQENFPAFAPLITQSEAEALLNRPVSRVLTVRCDRFHEGDSILIMGDAAHAVSPSLGQGCNAALEDVLIFNQLLDKYQDNLAQVLPQFSQKRIPDAHALQDLSNYVFPRNKWLLTEFFLRLTIGRLLHKWFPHQFQPFIFDLVLDTDMPYSQILNHYQGWVNKVKQSIDKAK